MFGARPVYPISVNHACMMTNIMICFMTFVHTWEGEAQLILKIIAKVQGADLRRFNKHPHKSQKLIILSNCLFMKSQLCLFYLAIVFNVSDKNCIR